MQSDAHHYHMVAVRTVVAETQFPQCSGKMKTQHCEQVRAAKPEPTENWVIFNVVLDAAGTTWVC